MSLYEFRCPQHGIFEERLPMLDEHVPLDASLCPTCGDWSPRRYSPPVTDCRSFGKNQYRARTPEHLRRARSEDQERTFRDVARETGARVQFGAGKSTGS